MEAVTPLEREYRYLIKRAEDRHDYKLAEDLRLWGAVNYDLDLEDREPLHAVSA